MKPEVLESHLVPMRPEGAWGFERIVEHESLEPCKHSEPCKELQDNEEFMKLKKFEPGEKARQDLNVIPGHVSEQRAFKVFKLLRGDMDAVVVGLPRFEPKRLERPRTVRVMPSYDNHKDMRMSCKKLSRAEFFSVRKQRGSSVINQVELDKLMAELDIS